jgi:hypothetical protein
MLKKNKNKVFIEEYFINDSYLKKLYNYYIRKTPIEKAIDYAVFFAIIFTSMTFILDLVMDLDEKLVNFIHTTSGIIFFIFVIELISNYYKSNSFKHFFKKHGVDFILVTFLSFYFLFVSFISVFKFDFLIKLRDYLYNFKKFRILFKSFKIIKK